MSNAIVLLSGGLDSTVALWLAKATHDNVKALWIMYGQPNRDQERGASMATAKSAGVEWEQAWCPELVSKTGVRADIPDGMEVSPLIVHARNPILLSMAANRGATHWPGEAFDIVIGATAGDEAFPDCTQTFVYQMTIALSAALNVSCKVVAPLVTYEKADIIDAAARLGCLGEARASWSCYRDGAIQCGKCRACLVRADGFTKSGWKDDLTSFVRTGGDPSRDAALVRP